MGYVLISLDVVTLFTSIPTHLVIESLFRRFNKMKRKCKIPFVEIIKCVEFFFNDTFFTFNNNT